MLILMNLINSAEELVHNCLDRDVLAITANEEVRLREDGDDASANPHQRNRLYREPTDPIPCCYWMKYGTYFRKRDKWCVCVAKKRTCASFLPGCRKCRN